MRKMTHLRRYVIIAVLGALALVAFLIFFPFVGSGSREEIKTLQYAMAILADIKYYFKQNHLLPRLENQLGAQLKVTNLPVNSNGDFVDGYGRPYNVFRSGYFIGVGSGDVKAYWYLNLKTLDFTGSDEDDNPHKALTSSN
jgi:hypothetical protein